MAFDDAGAPRQCETSGDGVEIAFEAVDEGVEAGQVVGADPLDPFWELVALELSEHLPERVDVSGEGVQFEAVGKDGAELQALALRQGVGVRQDPAGDRAWGRWAGCRCGRGCAKRLEADGSVAAGVALRFDLFPEGRSRRSCGSPLEDLVHWNGELSDRFRNARRGEPTLIVTFRRGHALAAAKKVSAGLASPSQLVDWAQAVHFEDHVDVEEEH